MKPLNRWENPLLRKLAIIVVVLLLPVWFPIVWVVIAIGHGVPATWADSLDFFKSLPENVGEAWRGSR